MVQHARRDGWAKCTRQSREDVEDVCVIESSTKSAS
jgi:hypothetical protein